MNKQNINEIINVDFNAIFGGKINNHQAATMQTRNLLNTCLMKVI